MTRPPLSSRVPAAIDGLVALAEAALPDVQVVDGPTQGSGIALKADVLAVATGDVAVAEAQERTGYTLDRRDTFSVMAVLSSWSGDPSMRDRRDRVAGILDALDQALRDDPTLGGVLEDCQLGPNLEWRTSYDQGAVCEVAFEISCRATI